MVSIYEETKLPTVYIFTGKNLIFFVTTAEEYFTKQSMIDVKELKESHPDFALVLDVNDDNLPDTSDLEHRRVPVRDVEVGSYILVGAGEVCHRKLPPHVNMVWQMTMLTLILRLTMTIDDKKLLVMNYLNLCTI